MTLRGDRRAVTVQVGAILLLGFLVISLSIYQATVVPAENKQVEFRHSQTVQSQLVDARNALIRTTGTDATQPASVDLGTQYPPRVLFVNPPPASGSLETVNTTDPDWNVTVADAESPEGEVEDFWNGSRVTYNTGQLVYRPGYNVYDGAPTTVYEHSLLYGAFDDGSRIRVRSGQVLVDGRRIHLVLLDGRLQRSGVDATTLQPRPLSVSSNTVTLRNEPGTGPINVTVPTRLSVTEWRTALSGETAVNVTDAPGRNAVNVTLQNATTYELKVSRVGLGQVSEAASPEAYLTLVDGPQGPVANGTTVRYTVEVRDKYNNPVSGVQVNNTTGGTVNGVVAPETATSNAEGRATFAFTPQCPPGATACEATLNLSIDDGNQPYETVEPSDGAIEVTDGTRSGGGGVGSDINPNSTNGVVLRTANITDTKSNGKNPEVEIGLENRDKNRDRKIVEARFNFYSVDGQGGSTVRTAPVSVDIANRTLKSANNGGQFKRLDPITLSAGNVTAFNVTFYSNSQGTTAYDVRQGDFFILSVIFGNGDTATYFIAPNDP